MVFTASLLGTLHERNSVEKKPASLLVMLRLDKTLNGVPPALCGKQVLGSSNILLGWSSLTKD